MIIDVVSDLHGFYPELEGGDLLIVAGDLTAKDTMDECIDFADWIDSQNYKNKIIIAGNHDNRFQIWGIDGTKEIYSKSKEYLCDSGTEFEGLRIWGSPWTKTFPGMNPHCKAFTVDTENKLAEKWDLIPKDSDILITHSPPFGIWDGISIEDGSEFHVGSPSLLEKIEDMPNLKLHIFGHIHEHGGKQMLLNRLGYGDENNITCVNASYVNERYKPVNKPIRIVL